MNDSWVFQAAIGLNAITGQHLAFLATQRASAYALHAISALDRARFTERRARLATRKGQGAITERSSPHGEPARRLYLVPPCQRVSDIAKTRSAFGIRKTQLVEWTRSVRAKGLHGPECFPQQKPILRYFALHFSRFFQAAINLKVILRLMLAFLALRRASARVKKEKGRRKKEKLIVFFAFPFSIGSFI